MTGLVEAGPRQIYSGNRRLSFCFQQQAFWERVKCRQGWAGLVPMETCCGDEATGGRAFSFPSYLGESDGKPDPQFCMQPRNVGLVGAPHRFPTTSNCVYAYFHACSCLWRSSSAGSRRRSSSAHGTVLAITSFDRTVEASLRTVGSTSLPGLRNDVLCTWAAGTGLPGAGTRDGEFHFNDSASAVVSWEQMTMSTNHHQWAGCLRADVG